MFNGSIVNIDHILIMFFFLPPHTPAVGALRKEQLTEVCRRAGSPGGADGAWQELLAGVMRQGRPPLLSCLAVRLAAHSQDGRHRLPGWPPGSDGAEDEEEDEEEDHD